VAIKKPRQIKKPKQIKKPRQLNIRELKKPRQLNIRQLRELKEPRELKFSPIILFFSFYIKYWRFQNDSS
jgi:hypothetical protein